jgi:hypothetical protein
MVRVVAYFPATGAFDDVVLRTTLTQRFPQVRPSNLFEFGDDGFEVDF